MKILTTPTNGGSKRGTHRVLRLGDLARRSDFQLGDLRISPGRRRIEGPGGSRHVEPQVMQVFLRLLDSAGTVVTRAELFEECWGNSAVGDDSLNRAVSGSRRAASSLESEAFAIETVPRTGYMLTLAPGVEVAPITAGPGRQADRLQDAVEEAYDRWRTGRPEPDVDTIRKLGSALSGSAAGGRPWGIYALLLRKAAEYADDGECEDHVRACERAARRALSLVPFQSDAQVALAGVVPIFGHWSHVREELEQVRKLDPDHIPAAHDLAVLEMSTGRVRAASQIIERLIARDPLAATFYYKRIYHLWALGEIAELEQVAARGLQLWPRHPAIWTARFWTLLFTQRAEQALGLVRDADGRPPMPASAVSLIEDTCSAVAAAQDGHIASEGRKRVVANAVAAAGQGPTQAVAGLLCLLALDAIDEAFDVALGYYLGRGTAVTPLRWNAKDASITDQHRRVTQPLFIPAARRMRSDPRFPKLCADIGLARYWKLFGLTPDFLDAQ